MVELRLRLWKFVSRALTGPNHLSIREKGISWKPLSRLSFPYTSLFRPGTHDYPGCKGGQECKQLPISAYRKVGAVKISEQSTNHVCHSYKRNNGLCHFVTGERSWCTKGLRRKFEVTGLFDIGGKKPSFYSGPVRNNKTKQRQKTKKSAPLAVLSFNQSLECLCISSSY